jgi:hypothetical protein
MSASIESTPAVRAPLNFAANRESGGVFSNFDPSLNSQSLEAHEVEVRDARRLPSPPKLDAEGFELHRLPFADANLLDPQWVEKVYSPDVGEYLQSLTGAAHVTPFRGHRVMIRDSGKLVPGRATAAAFVHIDQTRTSGKIQLERDSDPEIRKRYPRAKIFNVWRPLTAPPQDMPLAICDQRSLDEHDWVVGTAVEPGMTYTVENFSSVYNPGQRWHYFPDMTPDEMIVFKAFDNNPDAPIGCLHGAFRNPQAPADTIPRISAEARYLCFFES